MSAQLFAALLVLVAVNEQVAENLLGAWLKGRCMRLASIATGIGITYAGWYIAGLVPALTVLGQVHIGAVAVLGLVVGLGSNVIHALWGRYAPTAGSARLLEGANKGPAKPPTP